ncbi:DUF4043 domain-containing protein [Methylovirgula sp. 4M-Z18]|uniref:DUF4043 domain-containing protein n=1 Tax=Methylovirgula sp. 4M-Z18 TaxID=2293567 RepID=UPI000E2ECCEA|nr:DUF4043 domain-containing protein [Methylovirgula sp. 4M-Z18]RFB80005.1 DUF4043 domain-containing protein [Methylovirgula sp. 4M-Z18]
MPIQNMPAQLQAAIQQGFLETEFQAGLTSGLAYRKIADREPVAINIGESVTKTRFGYKAPATTPLMPSANTNLDNGLTSSPFAIEQYVLNINQYADTIDLNIVTSQVGIANQALVNAKNNGFQARQTLDRLARNALFGGTPVGPATFGGYLGGNTRVRTTLGSAGPTIAVDDVRGFELALSNGTFSPVTGSNTAQVLVGADIYTLQGVTRDATNVSTSVITGDPTGALKGISGALTFTTSVSVADGTAGNVVVHQNGPLIVRPSNRATWNNLVAGDALTAATIQTAVAQLRANTGSDETFDFFLDPFSMMSLYRDQDFKLAYQGQYGSNELRHGEIFQLYGCNFHQTNEAPLQSANGLTIRRPIIVAQGALIEGDFAGMTEKAMDWAGENADIVLSEGVAQVTRAPLDRLQQIIAQSWFWIGGFVTPSDATATQNIIPTASNAYLKRAVVIEHV